MSCKDKISNACGQRTNSRCVDYEGTVSNNSSLAKEGCLNIHETTQDLYGLVESIQEQLVPSFTATSCLDYPREATHEQVLETLDSAICTIQSTQVTNPLDLPIIGIDVNCLQTQCGTQITTIKELLQALVNVACA